MKTSHKILIAFSFLVTGLLITGFYYDRPCRHSSGLFLEKMGVFYIGVDNPVSISACGLDPSAIKPVISAYDGIVNEIKPGGRPGSYIVTVNGGAQTTIDVLMNDTLKTSLGSYGFRVKRIPDPVAYFGSFKADGMMTKAELTVQPGIFTKMENFDFDVKFEVISFEMSMLVNAKWKDSKAIGPALTAEMKSDLEKVVPGDKVLFNKVIAKGPDGTLRKIPGVIITVK